MTPRIVSAAMLMEDGLIVPGVRHFSPDMRAVLTRIYREGFRLFGRWIIKPYYLHVKEQGFIDSRGNFISREEAWKIADENGQIFLHGPLEDMPLIPQPAKQGKDGYLFSENLY